MNSELVALVDEIEHDAKDFSESFAYLISGNMDDKKFKLVAFILDAQFDGIVSKISELRHALGN